MAIEDGRVAATVLSPASNVPAPLIAVMGKLWMPLLFTQMPQAALASAACWTGCKEAPAHDLARNGTLGRDGGTREALVR